MGSKNTLLCCHKTVSPLRQFDATSTFLTQHCHSFIGAPCRHRLQQTSTSHELSGPSAYSGFGAHFFTPLNREASGKRYPAFRMCRIRGLATHFPVHATETLESLFQPSTLLGFALQSLTPFPRSSESFDPAFPLLHFPAKPCRTLCRCFSGLIPQEKLCPATCSPKV